MARDIVVLAGSAPHSVLALCKMAKKQGAHAYVVCVDDGFDYYGKSRLITESYLTTKVGLEKFWKSFFERNAFVEKPVLYPTTDAACLLIDENRGYYEEHFELCMPSHQIIATYNDKTLAEEDAVKWGLTVPKTKVVFDEPGLDELDKVLQYPIIAKPQGAIFLHDVGFKFKIIESKEQLSDLREVIRQGCKLVLQEYIPGDDDDYSFYLFYRGKDGKVHDFTGVKTLQYTGIMAVGTVQRDEKLASISRDFLNKINYYGIGGIEFKRYNGKYYFIEMSTRTEGFLAIALMSGASLIEASYLDFTTSQQTILKAKEKTVYIDTFFWLLNRVKGKKYGKLLQELLLFIFKPNCHMAGLYLDWKFSVVRYWNILTKGASN